MLQENQPTYIVNSVFAIWGDKPTIEKPTIQKPTTEETEDALNKITIENFCE